MKLFFRLFMALHAGIYRLSGGKLGGSMAGTRVLLLTTTGRKSGKTFTTPLGCFEYQGGYLIVASNAGQASHPGWYFNLQNNPRVTVQVMDKEMPVTAEVLSGEARSLAWQQVISRAPNYAAYAKKTNREIPLVLLRPDK
jgi:deazaflavin-dependent oxidoreductase (nitroreductase family)